VAEKLAAAPASIGENGAGQGSTAAEGDQQSMYALHLATQAMSRHEQLADNPALVFQRAVAARRAGQVNTSQAMLSPLRHRGAADPWGQCARAERWLAEGRSGEPPKPVVPCRRADQRPHLDGVLDEAGWQSQGDPESATADSAKIRWAYDAKYLYVGMECSKLHATAPEDARGPRPRDGDVERHDHLRLTIDVDRDYASWFELLVDSRGWTADRCWGDAAWNPQWYVARGESADGSAWTIEVAIPLAELSAKAPTAGAAWAVTAERWLPGDAPRSDAEAGPGEFSLLIFE
jgi:hypothetical protein